MVLRAGAWLEQINEIAAIDSNILVLTNMTGIGNMDVNVFQRGCDVVVPMQIPSAYQAFLVDNVESCAQKIAAASRAASRLRNRRRSTILWSRAEICFPPSACQFAGMEPARRGKRPTRAVLGRSARPGRRKSRGSRGGTTTRPILRAMPGDASHAA